MLFDWQNDTPEGTNCHVFCASVIDAEKETDSTQVNPAVTGY